MTYKVTVYQSGNSKVITIPAGMDIEVGEQFTLKQDKKSLTLKKIETPSQDSATNKSLKKTQAVLQKLANSNLTAKPEWSDVNKLEAEIETMYDD